MISATSLEMFDPHNKSSIHEQSSANNTSRSPTKKAAKLVDKENGANRSENGSGHLLKSVMGLSSSNTG